MKIIIAGSRNFTDYEMLKGFCDSYLSYYENIEIVSGLAKGADSLAIDYANEKGYSVLEFPANWKEFGKRAGYVRNEQMADVGDVLIAFWDCESHGTKHMIQIAKKKGLEVFIVDIREINIDF